MVIFKSLSQHLKIKFSHKIDYQNKSYEIKNPIFKKGNFKIFVKDGQDSLRTLILFKNKIIGKYDGPAYLTFKNNIAVEGKNKLSFWSENNPKWISTTVKECELIGWSNTRY